MITRVCESRSNDPAGYVERACIPEFNGRP
jgi:hypothetical protein